MPPSGGEAGLSPEQEMALATACDAACERGAMPLTSVSVAALVEDRRDLRPVYRQVRAELVARAAAAKAVAKGAAAGEAAEDGAEPGAGPGAGEPAAAVQAVA